LTNYGYRLCWLVALNSAKEAPYMKWVRLNVYLLPRQFAKLKAQKQRTGANYSEIIRRLIEAMKP
jgi:hypothetical protein